MTDTSKTDSTKTMRDLTADELQCVSGGDLNWFWNQHPIGLSTGVIGSPPTPLKE